MAGLRVARQFGWWSPRRMALLGLAWMTLSVMLLPRPVCGEQRPPSAWSVLQERQPARAAAASQEERRVLRLLTWDQLEAWLGGVDPRLIELGDGRALSVLLGVGPDLSWWTIDGGSGSSSGAEFSLTGTLGQPDAAIQRGGRYALGGGFWPRDPLVIFSDGFEGDSVARWSAAVGGTP